MTNKIREYRFQIGKSNALFHPQTFALMEHRRMRSITVHAVHATRRNNTNRWIFLIQHITNLNRRSVRAQYITIFYIKRVLHGTCRVILRNVQGLEIVEIIFNFGSVRDFKTHATEQFFYALARERNRVQTTQTLSTRRQRYV